MISGRRILHAESSFLRPSRNNSIGLLFLHFLIVFVFESENIKEPKRRFDVIKVKLLFNKWKNNNNDCYIFLSVRFLNANVKCIEVGRQAANKCIFLKPKLIKTIQNIVCCQKTKLNVLKKNCFLEENVVFFIISYFWAKKNK